MKYLRAYWFVFLLCSVLLLVTLIELSIKHSVKIPAQARDTLLVPDIGALPVSEESDLIRYGKELISRTSKYLGPHGTVDSISNGLDCENCHLEAGTKLFTGNFLAVATTYPKFRARSGRIESVEFRINECLQRSLNGKAIDSLSREMRAMVAYIKWTGKNVTENTNKNAIKSNEVPFLSRAADPERGNAVYLLKCQACHGKSGEGLRVSDSVVYPPLWGRNSYAVSAGMYRLTKLASFLKYNMPMGASYQKPQLTDEEAWDLAAFINSQPHPQTVFAYDWPVTDSKPVDYPFGPYTDTFSLEQHKYGPFGDIVTAKRK